MKSKLQKQKEMEQSEKLLKESQNLIFIDFQGATMKDLKKFRDELKKYQAKFKVFKKRLLRLVFQKLGINFDPSQFEAQLGTVFVSSKDIIEPASIVYKLFKETEKTGFKILGGFDLENKVFIDAEKMKFIGQLPKREIVLAQFLAIIVSPIRSFLYILSERSKNKA